MKINLDTIANFTWNFGSEFLLSVEDEIGKTSYYVWSDPRYDGDNTITLYKGHPENFTSPGFCGRDKGDHRIKDYCGEEVKFVGVD